MNLYLSAFYQFTKSADVCDIPPSTTMRHQKLIISDSAIFSRLQFPAFYLSLGLDILVDFNKQGKSKFFPWEQSQIQNIIAKNQYFVSQFVQ